TTKTLTLDDKFWSTNDFAIEDFANPEVNMIDHVRRNYIYEFKKRLLHTYHVFLFPYSHGRQPFEVEFHSSYAEFNSNPRKEELPENCHFMSTFFLRKLFRNYVVSLN